MAKWGGNLFVPFGSDGQFDVRANASGPIATGKLAAGFSVAFSERDGFTKNGYPQPVTRSDAAIDSREGFSRQGTACSGRPSRAGKFAPSSGASARVTATMR
jgi:outer membrane receptor protein involved in Fe transport